MLSGMLSYRNNRIMSNYGSQRLHYQIMTFLNNNKGIEEIRDHKPGKIKECQISQLFLSVFFFIVFRSLHIPCYFSLNVLGLINNTFNFIFTCKILFYLSIYVFKVVCELLLILCKFFSHFHLCCQCLSCVQTVDSGGGPHQTLMLFFSPLFPKCNFLCYRLRTIR